MDDASAAREQQLSAYERQFRRAGLPLLIEDFSAREDVFNRAFPLLALVLIAELIGALDVDWAWYANLGALAAALTLTLGSVALVNRARGRRALAIPETIGPVELAVFVLLPAVVQGIFHGGWGLAVIPFNLALLGLAVLFYGFGVGAIVVWAARRLTGQLARSLLLLARAVPLLLIFALVLFINAEMWQVFSGRATATLLAFGLLLAVVATAFLAARVPREVERLERDVLADADGPGGDDAPAPPLTRRQRANVGLVLLISHGLQIAVVTVAIGAFFVAFGMIVIDAEVARAWTGETGEALVSLTVLDVPLLLTAELLRVAGAIAALSGLYYAIAVLTDGAYREEFLDEVTAQMRETFSARAAYLALRRAPGSAR
jgi:MFS family permease